MSQSVKFEPNFGPGYCRPVGRLICGALRSGMRVGEGGIEPASGTVGDDGPFAFVWGEKTGSRGRQQRRGGEWRDHVGDDVCEWDIVVVLARHVGG